MAEAEHDLVVVGAGPGGYVAAIRAAQLGQRVALVDKEEVLGGTCLRVGCIPSKVLLEATELYHAARHDFGAHGIVIPTDQIRMDLDALMARKRSVVGELTDGLRLLMKKHKVTVVHGEATLTGPGRVGVSGAEKTTELSAPAIVLATGSVPFSIPGVALDGERVVTSTEALSFEKVPEHLVVIGAGAVGLELGSVWSRLGAKVTVVELLPNIVPFADRQIAKFLQRFLKKQGLELRVSARVESVAVEGDAVKVAVRGKKDAVEELVCDRVLVAVGRRANTAGLGLDRLGVDLDEAGRVVVDERFATNEAVVYAIGDLVPGPMLAHKAEEEGIAVAELLAGKPGHVSYDAIPSVVYTAPELAQVGQTEEQLKERDVDYRVGKFYFKGNGRAKSLGQVDGLVKILADAKTDRLLGVHVLGPRASELIAEAVTAFEFGGSAEDLARTVHAHPTLSEAVKEAALAVDSRAIHG